MKSEEIEQLNEWIYIRVFGWLHSREKDYPHRKGWSRDKEFCCNADMPNYCDDAADSRELEKKCLEKLQPYSIVAQLMRCESWSIRSGIEGIECTAPTLELAIAKFARRLFE